MATLARKEYRAAVQDRIEFKGRSVFARHLAGGIYAVFSQSEEWPLFIYRDRTWYENSDKYNPTASMHKADCDPTRGTIMKTVKRSWQHMKCALVR